MAGASLLALLDDIATVLDDIAIMTKTAAGKTVGVLGDDLALNAEQVSGVRAERELPVVWAVFKGAAINKLILVPAALAISAVAPQVVIYLLMLGGLYLCYEGVEKIWHSLAHKEDVAAHKKELHEVRLDAKKDLVTFEKDKIKGAIRTDFVLSAEIIVITLGTLTVATFFERAIVVCIIAATMTMGVYGIVAFIVKLDDMAMHLMANKNTGTLAGMQRRIGAAVLSFCPWLMKGLSVVGTAAMFIVGGGILVHGIPFLHHLLASSDLPLLWLAQTGLNVGVGVVAGAVAVLVVNGLLKIKQSVAP